MLPTPHLRFVKHIIKDHLGLPVDEPELILQQWWHKPGWTKVGDPDMGEWRDVPVVEGGLGSVGPTLNEISAESVTPVAGGEKCEAEHELPSWVAGRIPGK